MKLFISRYRKNRKHFYVFLMETQDEWIRMANLVYELDRRFLQKGENSQTIRRLYQRMVQTMEDAGIWMYNPINEIYSETRTDLEATISENARNNSLRIIEVLKPVLYLKTGHSRQLLQKGVVIVG